ncbi:ABC-three component system protein [Mycolicibacterium aichiense]|uniref:ABC-three component system protein n=1 Tax=Mycolicibacterium aichiense TaxID=1799 RepID=UPI003D675B08
MSDSLHSAADSAVGYIYQVKWALYEVLQKSRDRPDHSISLEKLDDVAWESEGTPRELLQLKHHAGTGPVGDMNPDVWRTLRVWMDAIQDASVELPDLYLVTTEIASQGSALAALRLNGRDPELAETLLLQAARTSTAKDTAKSRNQFCELSSESRRRLVEHIYVLDGAPLIQEIDSLVSRELTHVLPAEHENTYLDLLWAWWYSVALDMLQGSRLVVRGTDVSAKVSDLRDDFSRERLPTLAPAPTTDEELELAAAHTDRPFVHQIRWVDAPQRILEKAIVDYYRAIVQTRLWLEDDLIGLHELEDFERKLRDEWEREMAWLTARLPDGADEAERVAVGQELLRKVLSQTAIRVRERYDEPFFMRGKYHEMADAGDVGWHPDFQQRLSELLIPSTP